jgi:hypothetical protein
VLLERGLVFSLLYNLLIISAINNNESSECGNESYFVCNDQLIALWSAIWPSLCDDNNNES